MAVVFESGITQPAHHLIGIAMTHLNHRPQLFAEQRGKFILTQIIQLNAQASMPGKGHFAERRKQAAVTAIMIGQQ